MTVKVVITYYASAEDWDTEEVLAGRRVSDPSAQEDIKNMLSEDVQFIWDRSDIEISEAKSSL